MPNSIMVEGFASILSCAKEEARKAAIEAIENAGEHYQPGTSEDPTQTYWRVLTTTLEPHLLAALAFCRSDECLAFIALDYEAGTITINEVFSQLVYEAMMEADLRKNVLMLCHNDPNMAHLAKQYDEGTLSMDELCAKFVEETNKEETYKDD